EMRLDALDGTQRGVNGIGTNPFSVNEIAYSGPVGPASVYFTVGPSGAVAYCNGRSPCDMVRRAFVGLLLAAPLALAAPPQRIVSTAPSITEMLYALG